MDRRVLSSSPNAARTSHIKPILMAGDIISVRDSALIGLLNEVPTPFVGVYGFFSRGLS